jgi:organic radical activating enzyme
LFDPLTNFYCSEKFTWLSVDLEKKLTQSCCEADLSNIDLTWLKQNSGRLFNTPLLHKERTMMLNNERNASCEQNCWPAEDKSAISPRLYQNGQLKTHVTINTQPEEIDFTLTSECNLTCSYCCKEYSSAWKKDLLDNGDYNINDNRYTLIDKDKILYKLSQNEKINEKQYQILIDEVKSIMPGIKEFTITGGEPFLNNQLLSFIESAKSCNKIILYTGLGLGGTRFEKILNQLKSYSNLELRISAENVGKYQEFNRYGINADEFLQKIKLINDSGVKHKFHLTLSNLTIFGVAEFFKTFPNSDTFVTFAYQPEFMAINVLDETSKKYLLNKLEILPTDTYKKIVKSITVAPTVEQRTNLKTFVNRFVSARNLDLNIYPTNFIEWINQ